MHIKSIASNTTTYYYNGFLKRLLFNRRGWQHCLALNKTTFSFSSVTMPSLRAGALSCFSTQQCLLSHTYSNALLLNRSKTTALPKRAVNII